MTKHRNRRIAVALVFAAFVLALLAWRHLPDGVGTDLRPAPAAPQISESVEDPAVLGPTAHPAALPPPDAPVSTTAPSLQALADAGDSLAACRLAMELLRCEHVDLMLKNLHNTKPGLERSLEEGNLFSAQWLLEGMEWQLERQKACKALPADLRSRTAHYLTQAAHAGEPEAMLRYAEGQHLFMAGFAFHRTAEFDAWRRDALAMMQRALMAGRGEAVAPLMSAYDWDIDIFSGLVEDDPVEAQAYRFLFDRYTGRPERPDRKLNPQELARARALAEERHQRHFASRGLDKGNVTLMLHPTGMMDSTREQPVFCERPADPIVPHKEKGGAP